jgi:branched-chain amino acid transport system permease protein
MTTITENTIPATPHAMRDEMVVFIIMAALLAIVPFTGLYPFFVMQALCFALLACAFNLLIGYGGLLSFGHAMFLGTAGYCTAHALKVWGLPPELGIVVGVAAAAALSLITGYISIRRQGIYFSMITLALSQLLYFIYLQTPFTHGEDGIQGIPQGRLFGFLDLSQPTILYYVVLAGFLAGFLLIFRTINSPFGEVLKSIRENEQRAISLGAERLADRRALVDVGRDRADDAGRRPRHRIRTRGRRFHHHRHAAISGRLRSMGDGDPGHHLRGLRADLPPRRRRRNRPFLQAFALRY